MNYYLKITLRNFRKNKLYSFIKIGGFALGIAICFLISLYIKQELSYDRHYKNTDNIFRVVGNFYFGGEYTKGVCMQKPFAQALMDEFPEVEKAGRLCGARLFGAGSKQVNVVKSKKSFYEKKFVYADQNLLEILELPFINGNPKEALTNPFTIVITESMAKKLFPEGKAVGEILKLNGNENYTITGVIKDFPENSHLNVNFLMALYPDIFGQEFCWYCNNHMTYVRLKEETNIAALENKMKSIIEKYELPYHIQRGDPDAKDFLEKKSYELQPIKDIHLRSTDIYYNSGHNVAILGDIRIVKTLGLAALFILLLASINFINLTTAKASQRAKEMGLKKAIGAKRNALIVQIFGETMLYSLISVIIAVILSAFLLPFFNEISGKNIEFPWSEWWLLLLLSTVSIVIGFLAGVYPSWYLTSFKPSQSIMGKAIIGSKKSGLRNGLVVFQFAASIILIICTLVIQKQVHYILNKDLGYNKDQVVILHGTFALGDKAQVFKEEIESLPSVYSSTYTSYLPIAETSRDGILFWNEGKRNIEPGVGGQNWIIDHDYIKTLGLRIIEGRDFSKEIQSDARNGCIVNQEMVKRLGIENPVGKRIDVFRTMEIIGVVENFNFDPVENKIRPLLLRCGNLTEKMSIRVASADMAESIKSINKIWKNFCPDNIMHYTHMDEDFALMYENVQQLGRIFKSFALLAIIVAFLGLFGLVEFITKERTKEIGIRKVNGAKVRNVLSTLNVGIIRWIILALFIACPIAWISMSKWLDSFAYKTDLNWWIFALAGIFALAIALLTVSFQSWKAAVRNPVEALRYE